MFCCRFLLVVLLYGSIKANALKCNNCLGTKTSDCYNAKASSMVVKDCTPKTNTLGRILPFLPDQEIEDETIKQYCLQVIVKLDTFSEPAAARDCVGVPEGVDICKVLEIGGQVENCKSCSSDVCNNSTIT